MNLCKFYIFRETDFNTDDPFVNEILRVGLELKTVV